MRMRENGVTRLVNIRALAQPIGAHDPGTGNPVLRSSIFAQRFASSRRPHSRFSDVLRPRTFNANYAEFARLVERHRDPAAWGRS